MLSQRVGSRDGGKPLPSSTRQTVGRPAGYPEGGEEGGQVCQAGHQGGDGQQKGRQGLRPDRVGVERSPDRGRNESGADRGTIYGAAAGGLSGELGAGAG